MSKLQKKLWFWLGLLLIACPLGVILPELLHSGETWGEWNNKVIQEKTGFLPQGMGKDAEIWKAPIPDYTLKEKSSLADRSFHYILSAFIGLVIIGALTFIINRIVHRNE